MTISPTNLLIIAVVSVIIGYIAGILISNLRTVKADLGGQAEEPQKDAPSDGLIEIARLVREEARGPIQVKIDEKHLRLAKEMTPRERDVMEETTVELLNWLGYSPNANQTQPQFEEKKSSAEPVEQALPEPVMAAASAASVSPAAIDIPQPVVRKTGPLPPLPVVPVPVKEAPKSIVGQINDILQEKVEGTPFEYRRIRLVESPLGVMVQVGPEKYADINAVPDEDIRSLIRAAAAEWEKRAVK